MLVHDCLMLKHQPTVTKYSAKCFCWKPFIVSNAKPWQVLQAVSVIRADSMIRVAIRRALGYRHGYSHKTWIFRFSRIMRPRIMQSAWDIAPLAQSIISIVARIASWKEPYHYYQITVSARLAPLAWWPAVTRRRSYLYARRFLQQAA